jgi:accessory colonization factor AcfC
MNAVTIRAASPAHRCRALLACAVAIATWLPMAAEAQGTSPAPAETLFVYGPGGPFPAMKEAAADFARTRGVAVVVTGGPTSQWLDRARRDADVIFSGSEHMMTDFVAQLKEAPAGAIVDSTIVPLYLRPAAILVRKGNPRRIRRFEELLRPGVKVLVVQGAGQTGMWEDVAGRTGDIGVVRAFRRNIGAYAPNSGEAKRLWTEDRSFDAWLIWSIWQVANPELADVVPLAPQWAIHRDAGVALTQRGATRPAARAFVAHLRSADGARVFRKWGWSAPRHRR